jgi:hypothetical protein
LLQPKNALSPISVTLPGIVIDEKEDYKAGELVSVEIRNKLSKGDNLEIMIPGTLEPVKYSIEKLYDYETGEEIDTVNPGVKEQKVKLVLPFDVKAGYIIRRIK